MSNAAYARLRYRRDWRTSHSGCPIIAMAIDASQRDRLEGAPGLLGNGAEPKRSWFVAFCCLSFCLLAIIILWLSHGNQTEFEKEHARAEAANPPWLSIQIDTADGRRQYREDEYIRIVTRFSSSVRYKYKIDIATTSGLPAASDLLNVSDGQEIGLGPPAIACCGSRLIGLDLQPYIAQPHALLRLKPGLHEVYVSTGRVFPWNTDPQPYYPSSMETVSNMLKLKVTAEPGWQERKLAELQKLPFDNPVRCGGVLGLDIPAATDEKLHLLRNSSCKLQQPFSRAEYQRALAGMENMIHDPDYGIIQRDINYILWMKEAVQHPEWQKRAKTAEEYRLRREAEYPVFLNYERDLIREICGILPRKTVSAAATTTKTIEALTNSADLKDLSCLK